MPLWSRLTCRKTLSSVATAAATDRPIEPAPSGVRIDRYVLIAVSLLAVCALGPLPGWIEVSPPVLPLAGLLCACPAFAAGLPALASGQ